MAGFPTTPLLDDFNRGSLGAFWTTPAFGAANGGTITANQFNFTGAGAAVATAAKVAGSDVEAWLTIATLPTSGNIAIDIQCDSTASTVNCYQLLVTPSTSTVSIRHLIAGSATTVGATISQAVAAGDTIGVRVSGNSTVLIEFWLKPSGGNWTFIDSRSEARPSQIPYAPGFIGLSGPDTVGRYDDFGAGKMSVPKATPDLIRRAFPFLPMGGQITLNAHVPTADAIKNPGPAPYGSFERFVFPRLHPNLAPFAISINTPTASETITAGPYVVSCTTSGVGTPDHVQFEISADGGVTWEWMASWNVVPPYSINLNPWAFPNGNYQVRATAWQDALETVSLGVSSVVSFTITTTTGTTRDYDASLGDTLSAAIAAASDGDTIRLTGDFADEGSSVSCNKRVRIIKHPSAGSNPIVRSRVRFRPVSGAGTYSEDITFANSAGATLTDPSGNAIAFKRCDFTNGGSSGNIGQLDGEQFTFDGPSYDTRYDQCRFYGNGDWTDSTFSFNHIHGIYIQTARRIFVINCKAYDNTARQFQFYPNSREGTIYKTLGYRSRQAVNFGGDQDMYTQKTLGAQLLNTDSAATISGGVPADWPSSGTVVIEYNTGNVEYVTYTGISGSTLTGLGAHSTHANASAITPYTVSSYNRVTKCIFGFNGNDGLGNREADAGMFYGVWLGGGTPPKGTGNIVYGNFLHDPATSGTGSGVYLATSGAADAGGFTDGGGNLTGTAPGYNNAGARDFQLVVGAAAAGYGPDQIQPGTGHTLALGTAIETDTARPFGKTKTLALATASETDLAQALGRNKSRTLGVSTETDVAQTFARSKTRAVGIATETDLSQALGKAKTKAIGIATETDLGRTFTAGKSRVLGIAAEIDLPQTFAKAKTKAVGIATEVDLSQALVRVKSRTIGIATESDLAQSFSKAKTKLLGKAIELDLAQPITRAGVVSAVKKLKMLMGIGQ